MKEKLKELTKDTAIYGISTMLGRFLNFLLVPFYTNVFLPSEYGVVNILYSYIAIFNIIFLYGMDSAFLKYAAFKDIGDDKENFSTPYISVFISSVLLVGFILLFKNPIAAFLDVGENQTYLIVLSALILFFDSNVVIPFLKLRLERKAKFFSMLRVANILINISLNIILIVKLKWGIKANYKLGIFMMLFVNMFQFAWQPFFLNNAKEENAKEIFSKVLTYFTIVGSIMLVILSLFISDIVKINFWGFSIIGANYWSGLYIVPVILLGYLFNGLYVVFSAGIYIEEKSLYAPIVAGAGAITNVAVNYLLIPYFNIMGAAFATLASYVVMASGYYLVTQKFYKINYDYSKLAKIALAVILTGIIYYLLMFGGVLNIYYKLFLAIIFITFILLNVFEKNEMDFIKTKLLRR